MDIVVVTSAAAAVSSSPSARFVATIVATKRTTAAASIPPTTSTGFIVISSGLDYTMKSGRTHFGPHRGEAGIVVRGFADAVTATAFDTHPVNGKTLHHRALA